MLSKEVSSTIFKVFDMTRPGIEPWSPGSLTNTLPTRPIMTYNTHKTLKEIKIRYQKINVELYIPNPLRCYKCQRFGHHQDQCT